MSEQEIRGGGMGELNTLKPTTPQFPFLTVERGERGEIVVCVCETGKCSDKCVMVKCCMLRDSIDDSDPYQNTPGVLCGDYGECAD